MISDFIIHLALLSRISVITPLCKMLGYKYYRKMLSPRYRLTSQDGDIYMHTICYEARQIMPKEVT